MLLLPLDDMDGAGVAHPTTKRMGRNDIKYRGHSADRRVTFRSLLKFLALDFEDSHHAVVFMVQDVAMEHPLPWVIVVADDDARRRVLGHVQHVLPGEIRLTYAVTVEYLELEPVQVERVIHADDVLDLPDLSRADLRAHIYARHVHQLAIDHALAENDG